MASSTEMLVSMTSSSMMKAMFPDVGLGTVGIYTTTMDLSLSSEYTCPVTKPIATIPSRGHSMKTTRLKLNCPSNDVIACWVTPNTVPTTGMLPMTASLHPHQHTSGWSGDGDSHQVGDDDDDD